MKTLIETFYFDGSFILEVGNEYVPTSVKAWYFESDTKLEPIKVNEIGGKFVGLDEEAPLTDGIKIKVEYGIESGITKFQTNERLQRLEKTVYNQQKVIESILEALRHRVDIHTFTTYLKSLENQLGIDIFDNVFTKPYPNGTSRI